MSIRERLIHYQNTSEENFKEKKSLKNAIHYLLAFFIFMSSTVIAGLTMPFRMISKSVSKPKTGDKLVVMSKDNKDPLLKDNKLVLLDFWAEWCGPCIMMNPVLKEFVDQSDEITIAKVNADVQPAIVKEFKIRGLPTFVLMQNGKEIKRHAGPMTLSDLKKFSQTL